jgi:hypothetical protein
MSSSTSSSLVDASFERIFGYRWGEETTTLPMLDDIADTIENNNSNTTSILRLRQQRQRQQLVPIFGPIRAARIMKLPLHRPVVSITTNTTSSTTTTKKRRRDDDYGTDDDDGGNEHRLDDYDDDDDDVPTYFYKHPMVSITTTTTTATITTGATTLGRPQEQQQQYQRRKVIREEDYKMILLPGEKSGTGSTIKDTATVSTILPSATSTDAVEVAASTTTTSASSTSQLDKVLQHIAGGPKKKNTVEKTSEDWDSFKSEHQLLHDEIERAAQSKDAYLVKKEFLQRVDERTFLIEKDTRDQERAKRTK